MHNSSDVTDIQWNPSRRNDRLETGNATIEHKQIGHTIAPMTKESARRLAFFLLGDGNVEVRSEDGIHWARASIYHRTSDVRNFEASEVQIEPQSSRG
jgi:hypothetical protein